MAARIEFTASTESNDSSIALAAMLRAAADLVESGYSSVDATQDPSNDANRFEFNVTEPS